MSFRVERALVARAVYRAAPAVFQPAGDGTAVEVAAEEVVWPQQPVAEVRRLYYVAVGEPGYVEGVRARLASWCGLGLRCRRPLPVVFAGWVGLNATGARQMARPISASLRLVMQCLSPRGTAPLRTRPSGLTSAT